MVLRLKTWESRSPPGLLSADCKRIRHNSAKQNRLAGTAGWSSPVARQAHNLKVVGSNPTPATKPSSPTIITHALTRQPVRRLRRFATVASPRQAHNLKVVGSNPTPATKPRSQSKNAPRSNAGAFCFCATINDSKSVCGAVHQRLDAIRDLIGDRGFDADKIGAG